MRVTWWRYSWRLTIVGLIFGLAGCQASPIMDGAWRTLQSAVSGADQPTSKQLDPRFAYLRATAGKKLAFLALGYVDPHPLGPIEVWYSAEREVIRLQNGRVVGAAGTLTEWRQVRMPDLPRWRDLATKAVPHAWTRTRDVMPGYYFNHADLLQVRTIPPPAKSALVGIAPASLTWFEESLVAAPASQGLTDRLPPARYAVEFIGDTERVIYAEQCLSAALCITWQRWRAGQ